MARIHLGCSGYVYKHWRGLFYPQKLPARLWLKRYAQAFSTVELNTTFYRLPRPEAVDNWRTGTPPGFVFAAKGSRFITHMKKLNDPEVALQRYFEPILRLRDKLHVVLWQLPPMMEKLDLPKLSRFLALLPTPEGLRYAFEFRTPAWYVPAVCDLLDEHGAAFCEHDALPLQPPRLTGGFRYVRFHGTTGRYVGRYGREALRPWAQDLLRWKAARRDAYVYFNNDTHGHALYDALDLSELLDEERARPREQPLRALLEEAGAPIH